MATSTIDSCGCGTTSRADVMGISNNHYKNHIDEKGVISGLKNNLIISPGEQVSYTARMFGGNPIELSRLLADNRTIETANNHCLDVGDAIHIDVCSGMCSSQTLSSCTYIESVPAPNQFTLRDGTTPTPVPYTFTPTLVDDPDPTVPGVPVSGFVARAADLAGYRCRLRLVIGAHRDQKLISLGAVASGSKQIQLKGNFTGFIPGDKITLGGFTGTVVSYQKATYDNLCYTIIQTAEASNETVKFTDKKLALHVPDELVIETTVPALSCGWASASISGFETKKLVRFTSKERGNSVRVGFWEFCLEWGGIEGGPVADKFPDHIAQDYDNFYSFIPIDRGILFLI